MNELDIAKLQREAALEKGVRKSKGRDLMIHAAISIVDRCNGVQIIGLPKNQVDIELGQFAVEVHYKNLPMKRAHLHRALAELMQAVQKRLEEHGGVR